MAKYGVRKNGYDIPNPNPQQFCIWGGLLLVKESFFSNIRYCIGTCDHIRFWLDMCVGEIPMLFQCARDWQAVASSYMGRVSVLVVWGI